MRAIVPRTSLAVVAALSLLFASGCSKKEAPASEATAGETAGGPEAEAPPATETKPKGDPATELARKVLIVDGHIDLPFRLDEGRAEDGSISENVAEATEKGDFDYPRAVAGGLDAPFMSIYVPAEKQVGRGGKPGDAKAFADALIDLVEALANDNPTKFALAGTPDEVRANHKAGKITLLMGIENGAPIGDDLANVEHFFKRGVRYVTLAHSKWNQLSDSSYDEERKWKGLSPLGKQVVAEMNRLGMLIDIAHVSDDAFAQVIELTKAPVIASHSSARKFTPGFERNMSDDMIKALADNGGVIMINFGSSFISDRARKGIKTVRERLNKWAEESGVDPWSDEGQAKMREISAEVGLKMATVEDVADHIDHVAKLVGVDHVGLGSDFDGVGPTLPTGLEDASKYPNLFRVLLARGYSDEDIAKIAGGNLMRVWEAAQAHAASQGNTPKAL